MIQVNQLLRKRQVVVAVLLGVIPIIGIVTWRALPISGKDSEAQMWDAIERDLGPEGSQLRKVVSAQNRALNGHGTPDDIKLASASVRHPSARIRREGYVLAAFLYRQNLDRPSSQALIHEVKSDPEHSDASSHFLFLARAPGWQEMLAADTKSPNPEVANRAQLDWQAAAAKGLLQ